MPFLRERDFGICNYNVDDNDTEEVSLFAS
jgi:hypothetical protein